jgi:hypothetical protein
MIRKFEAAEFITALLKQESQESVTYNIEVLKKKVQHIERKHPYIQIDMSTSSLSRFMGQCDNIVVTKREITIKKRNSLTTRCLIAHNVPSLDIRKVFNEKD